MKISEVFRAAADVLMPRECPVCGKRLVADERHLCRLCLECLPRTHFESTEFNAMEQLFAGKTPVERAVAYFWYEKGTDYSRIILDMKYHNMPAMGRWLARRAASDMLASGVFDTVDCITAVPLSRDKLATRGYNQSAYIAKGVADVTGLPVVDVLAARSHGTQTRKSAFERMVNAQGIYYARGNAASQLAGKHVLIVDDVVTSGATLLACAESLAEIADVRISLFALSAARID